MAAGRRITLAPGLRKRQRADGTWAYEFDTFKREPSGKVEQRRTTLTEITTDEEALEMWGALRRDVKQGKLPVAKGDLRLDSLAVEMFIELERDVERGTLAEGTLRNYKGDWANHVQPYFDNCKVKDISHRELIDWLKWVEDKPGRGLDEDGQPNTMSAYSVNNAWNVVRNLMRFAFEREYLPLNPCLRVPRKNKPVQQPRRSYVIRANDTILHDDELTTLLDYMREKEEPFVGATTLLAYTGMRLREGTGLRPADHVGSRILLGEQLLPLRKGEAPRYGKRKEERLGIFKRLYRVVPVMPRLEQELVLQSLREPEGSQFLFTAIESPGTRPIDGATLTRAIARSGERSGVGRITPKDLRRTAACIFAAAGIDRQVASQILGHTPEVYDASYARAWADEREQEKVVSMLTDYRFGLVDEEEL